MDQKKLLFLDVETTGLNSYNCAIVQIYGIVRINGVIKEEFEIRMRPHRGAKIDVNSNFNRNKKVVSPERGLEILISKLEKYVDPYNRRDKFFIVAYNARYDTDFIRAWFTRNDNQWFGSYFWHPSMDVMHMALEDMYKRNTRHEVDNMRLGTVAQYYGLRVTESSLHDAKYDTRLTKDLYNRIKKSSTKKKNRKRYKRK